MVQGAQLFMNNFANQTGGGGSRGSNRVALAEACDVACDATQPPQWGAWGGGAGRARHDRRQGQPLGGVTYNVGGFAAGLDRLVTPSTAAGRDGGLHHRHAMGRRASTAQGSTDTFQAGLYGDYAQGKVYADAVVGLRLQLATRCGATSRSPACGRAPRRAAPAPTSSTASSRPATASISARTGRGLRHAVRPPAGLHRHAERLHRDRRAVAQPHGGAADHQLAALGAGRAARRRDGSRLARQAACSSGWAGATNMPTRRGR